MNKKVLETRPAVLQFCDGKCSGVIYAHLVEGRIVEAYRGYGYRYTPIAPAVRTQPAGSLKT